MIRRNIIFTLLSFFCGNFFSQADKTIDSLKLALKNAVHDSARCNILFALAETAGDDEWPQFNEQLKVLAEKNVSLSAEMKSFYLKYLGAAHNNIGFLAQNQGNVATSLKNYQTGLKCFKEIQDKKGMASSYNNLGSIYNYLGNINLALEYYQASLTIKEQSGDKSSIANALNNIAGIYYNQDDVQKALEYWMRALKMQTEIKDKRGMALSLDNIGSAYYKMRDNTKAMEFYKKGLTITEEIENKKGIANALNHVGGIYLAQRNFDLAIEYFNKALAILEKLQEKNAITITLNYIGNCLIDQGKLAEATTYLNKGLQYAKELGFPERIKNAAHSLKIIYKKQNKNKEALEMYELEIRMMDSVSNTATKKASIKTQLKYEYEKKSAADSVKNAEEQKVKDAQLAAQNASLKQEKFQRYSLAVGLLLVVLGLLFVVNRFRITQKQKKIIEEQKVKVDEAFKKLNGKNKEVMDSIYYARRIQRASITSEHYVSKNLKRLKR
ncbi:MAG: tetratricopeptide repeat protein [Bacteroidia bacterium]|nr:tetratricopeptide repeat protein [Bacteroidia bacterium]